jgi:hypothetical protein
MKKFPQRKARRRGASLPPKKPLGAPVYPPATIVVDDNTEVLLRASLELNQQKAMINALCRALDRYTWAYEGMQDSRADDLTRFNEMSKLHLEATLRNADLTLRLQQVMASGVCEVGGRRWVDAGKIAEVLA